jgi:hypothetical protein
MMELSGISDEVMIVIPYWLVTSKQKRRDLQLLGYSFPVEWLQDEPETMITYMKTPSGSPDALRFEKIKKIFD